MIDAAVFIGRPLKYKNFLIYPPKVSDVVSNPQFGYFLKVLTMSQEELQDEFNERGLDVKECPTPLEFLLSNCYNDKKVKEITEEAFFFFFHRKPSFLYQIKSIILNLEESIQENSSIDEVTLINEDNFFEIQNVIRKVCGLNEIEKPPENEDPRITAMKAKARYRDRIKAKHGGGLSIATSLCAICCMGIGINPLNVGEISYAAIAPILTMYQSKEKYQIDIDSLIAGADSKKVKPKYWIQNLDD